MPANSISLDSIKSNDFSLKKSSITIPNWSELDSISLKNYNNTKDTIDANKQEGLPSNFSENDITPLWNEFKEKYIALNEPILVGVLEIASYRVLPNSIIQILLTSEVQKNIFNNRRTEFLELVRKKLNNQTIDIEYFIIPQEEDGNSGLIFTKKERFKKLVEEKPVLIKLLKELDLDGDF